MSRQRTTFRRLRFEYLEDRALMDSTGLTGASQPISQLQPSLALNYIIATSGSFPQRDVALVTSDYSQNPYIGEVRLFAGTFAPSGYALANGQILSIAQNNALFALLGTNFGGDGLTTFALPDLRGRVPVRTGQGPGLSDVQIGQAFGSETNVLAVGNLPSHSHTIPTGSTSTTGNGQAFLNQQPSLGLTVGMASEGSFSSITEFRYFAQNFNSSPDYANGQSVSINSAIALFTKLGTTYGGDGINTFVVPDVRGRALMGAGQGTGLSPYALGQSLGTENTILVSGNLPAHSHTAGTGITGTTGAPAPTSYSQLQPSLAVRYYIRTIGVFPSRDGSSASDVYIGEVHPFAAPSAPSSEWTAAEGQILPIDQYSALYAILGSNYGGDGITTFALPDLRGRLAIGAGQGPGLSAYSVGQKIGAESTTLTVPMLAEHAHGIYANDNFANPEPLAGATASAIGSNVGFTGESGEPNHAAISAPLSSAWWQWTAPISGTTTMNTFGSNFDTTLAVYTGSSISALTPVVKNDDSNGPQSQVVFNATAGTVYRIAVDGRQNATGDISLFLTQANDAFSNRSALSGVSTSTTGSNFGFTGETFEPSSNLTSPLASAWWKWTAPKSGLVTIDTAGSNFDTTLGIYSGVNVSTLTQIGFNDDAIGIQSRVVFNAVAGTTYNIAVDGYLANQGDINLMVSMENDSFANRYLILGTSTSTTGNNFGFTGEIGEPNHASLSTPSASAWWQWTAPSNGTVTINTFGSNFDTTLAVYTGSSVNALTLIAANDDSTNTAQSQVTFIAIAGTNYDIAVDGYSVNEGNIDLTLNQVNDVVILNRQIFYNRSTSTVFGDGSGNPVGAIDSSKEALRPGEIASSSNYTNYSRGLNGIVIDIANQAGTQTATDFQFATWNGFNASGFTSLSAIPTITVIPAGGVGSSKRIKIEFSDNTIRNTWLRVTMLGNTNTGLSANDVFYFGNAVGDMNVGNSGLPVTVQTNEADVTAVRQNLLLGADSAAVTNIYDLNKDGRVNAIDTAITRQSRTDRSIRFFSAPLNLRLAITPTSSRSLAMNVPTALSNSVSSLNASSTVETKNFVANQATKLPPIPVPDDRTKSISALAAIAAEPALISIDDSKKPASPSLKSLDAFFAAFELPRV